MAGFDPENLLEVVSASGPFIQLASGQKLIDALSSWWCKPLGHGHPRLRAALIEQAGRFEHVIQAETTNATIAALSERLGTMVPGLPRVFYGGDGSMAVEIALKLALHANQLRGQGRRQKFAALRDGYHGETQMALAVGDQSLYGAGFLEAIPRATLLGPLPHVSSSREPAWRDCSDHWPAIERQLEAARDELCAVIVEPILQGAGQMRLYSPDLLARLRRWCTAAEVYLIADEILTGFGRTGKLLACEHAGVTADLVCLSKGLTAGWLPLSAVLVSEPIFELCSGGGGRAPFLHSNTYTGNPLAAAIAVEALKIYDELDIGAVARALEPKLRAAFERIASRTGKLRNVRALGGMVAAELVLPAEEKAAAASPGEGRGGRGHRSSAGQRPSSGRAPDTTAKQICREAIRRGALMRPLGDTLYWLPPLNLEDAVLAQLEESTAASIAAVLL
jgi:adenosylmethionine-8-amino-7-oxononanoate aminotransferase